MRDHELDLKLAGFRDRLLREQKRQAAELRAQRVGPWASLGPAPLTAAARARANQSADACLSELVKTGLDAIAKAKSK